MSEQARIVASHGKSYQVELADGRRYSAVSRGKKTDFACGDRVQLQLLNAEQAVIERVEPRQSLLYRSDAYRSKLIAANVSQLLLVLAPVPSFSEELLSRGLLAAEDAGIEALIVLNKSDLPEAAAALARLEPYRRIGYRLLQLSAKDDVSPLRPQLQGQCSVLVGQSGMGKSTILNALLPDARVRTGDISVALDSGRHTTTHASLYHLDAESQLIDSPGLQEFGLHHLSAEALTRLFPEFRPYLGDCRFHNCRHLHEPGCALLSAQAAGSILPQRLGLLQKLFSEVGR